MKSCLICGIGGQGTVLASRIIAAAAIEKGLFARTAETIGMAQRGGIVVSHVRIGETVYAPLIPLGGADVILGFEPGEAVRSLGYLKPGGTVIVCDRAVPAVTASLSAAPYSGQEMLNYLRRKIPACYVLDADGICAACGSSKVLNVALIGALAAWGGMDLSYEDLETATIAKVNPKFTEMNQKALRLGAGSIQEMKV